MVDSFASNVAIAKVMSNKILHNLNVVNTRLQPISLDNRAQNVQSKTTVALVQNKTIVLTTVALVQTTEMSGLKTASIKFALQVLAGTVLAMIVTVRTTVAIALTAIVQTLVLVNKTATTVLKVVTILTNVLMIQTVQSVANSLKRKNLL